MTKMFVYSLDYDACMASTSIDEIITENRQLIEEILEHINAGDKVTLCVGSNRQNRVTDLLNSSRTKTPSVYSAYPALVNDIIKQITEENKRKNIQFDGFLTEDALNNVAPGTHFKEHEKIRYVIEGRPPKKDEIPLIRDVDFLDHAKCTVDDSKISILYAQMHHFASLHPSEKIEFIFKDDKADILKNLHTFYSQNPELIPRNVTLKLEQKLNVKLNNAINEKIKELEDDDANKNKDEIIKEAWLQAAQTQKFQEVPPIEGKGISIDRDYSATSTAMFVIAYNLTHNLDAPSFNGNMSTIDLKGQVKSFEKSTRDIYKGYLSESSNLTETNPKFSNAFKQYKEAQKNNLQLKNEVSRRMNVLVDVSKEAQQNTLTSDHELQEFDGPILKHASYNVAAITTNPFCMKDIEPYKEREFMPRLEKILGKPEAANWNQRRLEREQKKITAAAKQGILLFNLQETSDAFVKNTLQKLNTDIPNKYQTISKLYNDKPGNFYYNLAIIYDSQKLTPIGDAFIRDDLTSDVGPDRVLVQAFKDEKGNYIVMQNIHGQHYSNAKEGEKNLVKAMMLPDNIKENIEKAIQNDGGKFNYTVSLTGDTNRRRPPTDDEFKYIGVNTSTFPGETFWNDKQCIDYTDGSITALYENGILKEDSFKVVNSKTLNSNGDPIDSVKVNAEFALANNHFQEFPFTSHYTLDNFQERFMKLKINDCDITPEKNDFNVCRVKITSKQDISDQLKQEFKYVEKNQTNEGFKYTVYPNAEIAQLKIKKRAFLEKSMHSELMNLVIEGDTERLGATIKEWLDCYPDLLKNVLEINNNIQQDIFLNCSSLAKFNLGEAWENGQFPNRPSISAILNYAAYQVGVEHFGHLNKYTETQKKQYIQNTLNIYLSEKDRILVKELLKNITDNERGSSNDALNTLIHFLRALKTPLEPPLRVLEKSPTKKELSDSKFLKEEGNYKQAKDLLLKQIDINKQIGDQIEKRRDDKNENTKQAKINIAVGVTAALVGGAAIAAIIFTAPFSLPAIIGLTLVALAITTTVLATSARARSFLKEATKSQCEIDSLSQFLEQVVTKFKPQIQQSVNNKKTSLSELEQKASTINKETNDKMDAIAQEIHQAKIRDMVIQEPINRKNAEEEIQANTNQSEQEKYALRTKTLSKKQQGIIEEINNLLLSIGNQSLAEDVRQPKLNMAIELLKKLPPDIRSHFQDYFYEQAGSEWKVKLDLGIKMVKEELSKNPIQIEKQNSYANRQNAAGILFFKPSSEKNSIQISQHNKEQLKAIKNDSEESNVKPLSSTCPF